MFKDRDPAYRQNAITALGAIGTEDKRVIPALIGALKDGWVNDTAANALARIGKEVVPELLQLLKGKDNELRASAARTLSHMGPIAKEAIPTLIKCLDEQDENLRYAAAGALGQMAPDSKSAIPALIKLLKEESPESPDGGQRFFPHL